MHAFITLNIKEVYWRMFFLRKRGNMKKIIGGALALFIVVPILAKNKEECAVCFKVSKLCDKLREQSKNAALTKKTEVSAAKPAAAPVQPATREIGAEDLLKKVSTPDRNTMIVNVLGKRYYDDCRIRGSISAPLKNLEEIAQGWDKNKEIIVYCACRECDASLKAFRTLVSMGFTNVLAYEGGIREWYKKGYPYEGAATYPYLNEEGDSHRLMTMRDCALKSLLLDVYWGVRS